MGFLLCDVIFVIFILKLILEQVGISLATQKIDDLVLGGCFGGV